METSPQGRMASLRGFLQKFRPQKALPFLKSLLPYALIFIVSVAPFWVWMSRGDMTSGDDVSVHLSLVYDLLEGFKRGFIDGPNHVYLGNYAINANLFYGMLPHYLSAGIAYLFGGLGASVIGSMKFVAYLSVAVSAVFSYKLVKRIDGRMSFGMAAAIATIYFPYRYHCLFYRAAFAEGVAIGFIPVFIYGLYAAIDEKEVTAGPFVAMVLGLVGLVDSHPYTALITFGGALLLFVGMLPKLISKFKSAKFWAFGGISVVAAVFLMFPFVFPMLQAVASGNYRLSDESLMWQDIESVVHAIEGSYWRAGFIDFEWRANYAALPYDEEWRWWLSIGYFPAACLLSILSDALIRRFVRLKELFKMPVRVLTMALILFLPPLILDERAEVYMGFIAFFLTYALAFFVFGHEEDAARLALREKPLKTIGSFFGNTEIYAVMAALAMGFVSLFSAAYWENSSSLLRICQFPFRYWSILAFFLLLLAAYLFKPFASFRVTPAIAMAMASMLAVVNQPFIDKRIYCYEEGNGWTAEPTEEWVASLSRYGYQNEYAPAAPFEIFEGEREASYPNSLAKEVASNLVYNRAIPYGIDEYIQPVFLEGSGTASIVELNTPEVTFDVACTEGALLQLPQFYYDGYAATATFADGTSVSCEVVDVDGLVAARLPEGEFELSFSYLGPLLRRIGYPLMAIGAVALASLGIFSALSRRKNRGAGKETNRTKPLR